MKSGYTVTMAAVGADAAITSCHTADVATSSDYLANATPLSNSTGGRAFASNAGGAIYSLNGVVALVAADLVVANVLK